MRNWLGITVLLGTLLLASLPAQAQSKRRQGQQLEQMQSALTAAIRWGEFEEAWELVDPAYRQAHPMTELVLARYQQVQVSGYTDRTSSVAEDGTVLRNIDLRVINKHTMAERTVRYREQWRWDAEARRWWLAGGLPDLWEGE
jgi:hypothetical protein